MITRNNLDYKKWLQKITMTAKGNMSIKSNHDYRTNSGRRKQL